MKRDFVQKIRCPDCNQALSLVATEIAGDDIVTRGQLTCAHCGANYPIRKGIPYLLPSGGLEPPKQEEMEGWVRLWEKKGMYARGESDDSYKLPYLDGPWADVAKMFEQALSEMDLRGDEKILDLGAGQGWASRYFAERGCDVIAVDIVDDEWYGLGRAWAIMKHAGVYFQPIIADGENLPFPPGSFDIVFMQGALHHFEDTGRVLAALKKVLKVGGRIFTAGEPAISVTLQEEHITGPMEETREGIIERRPTVSAYRQAFLEAGFVGVEIDSFETLQPDFWKTRHWLLALGRHQVPGLRPRYRPLALAALGGLLFAPAAIAARAALYFAGGNLIIRARKPGGHISERETHR